MTRTTSWYLSSRAWTKLNTGKRLLAAFWPSPGPTAQHFWLSLHHHYKCPKLTVSGLHLWQFIQLLWLGFCKISSDVYSQMQKIRVDYCAFPWQISHASLLCLLFLWWHIGHQPQARTLSVLDAIQLQEEKATAYKVRMANTREARIFWDTATFQNEALLPPTHEGIGHRSTQQVSDILTDWQNHHLMSLAKFEMHQALAREQVANSAADWQLMGCAMRMMGEEELVDPDNSPV